LAATACVLLTGSILSGTVASGHGTTVGSGHARQCGNEIFAPRSEDGAFSLTADGTTCRVARIVASGSRPQSRASGNPTYSALSFRCRGKGGQLGGMGKYVVTFVCSRGSAKVHFVRG
jgi:hypothetical protein